MKKVDNLFISFILFSVCSYYGKRSADAEPEAEAAPQYWGRGYYGGYRGYYGRGWWGKRSADAEPEAEAAPQYWGYGGRGYYGGGYYRGWYGKRSADAEPEAEAAPQWYYGAYYRPYYY